MDYGHLGRELTRLATEFEQGFLGRAGYPPDLHEVGGPAPPGEVNALVLAAPGLAEANVTFYRHISEVSLPDVGNGLFLERPSAVVAGMAAGRPAVLLNEAGQRDILCVGTDGGGAYFAIDLTDGGTVLYLPPSRVEDGVYTEGVPPVRTVADSLPALAEVWCDELRHAMS